MAWGFSLVRAELLERPLLTQSGHLMAVQQSVPAELTPGAFQYASLSWYRAYP